MDFIWIKCRKEAAYTAFFFYGKILGLAKKKFRWYNGGGQGVPVFPEKGRGYTIESEVSIWKRGYLPYTVIRWRTT